MALSIYKFKKKVNRKLSELVFSIGVVTAKKQPFVNYKVTMSMKVSYVTLANIKTTKNINTT